MLTTPIQYAIMVLNVETVVTCRTRMYSVEVERLGRRVRALLNRGDNVTLQISLSRSPRCNPRVAMKSLRSFQRSLGESAIVIEGPTVAGNRALMRVGPSHGYGGAGVREPRRPRPSTGTGRAALDV